MFAIKYIPALALFFVATSVLAEPTKQETINFIQNKTNLVWTDNKSGKRDKKEKISISDCSITHVTHYYLADGQPTYKKIAELKHFDPTLTKFDKYNTVNIYTREHLKKVDEYVEATDDFDFKQYVKWGYKHNKQSNTLSHKNYSYSILTYVLSPEEINGPKVLKAFNHLIKLCGGKGELF